MCETLMSTVEKDSWCEENALAEDCVCVTHKTGDWQKMLRHLYDNDGQDAFIPAYPLSAIIESEVELTDDPAQLKPILMVQSDAQDVMSLAALLCNDSSS